MNMIANWLDQYGWKVYYNQKNNDNRPIFHANSNSKPDILLEKNKIKVLVEVKPGNKHRDILDGYQQLVGYAGEYHIGRVQYDVEKRKNININAFVLATQYSLSGFLYNDEQNTSWMCNDFLEEQYDIVEKPISHSITRLLWREWRSGIACDFYNIQRANRLAKGIVCPGKRPKIGILVSRVDKKHRVTGIPFMFLDSNKFCDMSQRGEMYPFY